MEKKKILIVDDQKDTLKVLEKRLSKAGFLVLTALNGNDCLSLAKSEVPDVIVLDMMMPGMDGVEVAEKLKENLVTKDIPVLFLTCLYSKAEEVSKGHVRSGHVMFAKPCDIQELVAEIDKVLKEKDNACTAGRV